MVLVFEPHVKKTVKQLTLHRRRAPFFRLDVFPFVCMYALPLSVFFMNESDIEESRASDTLLRFYQTCALGVLGLMLVGHLLVFLAQHWSKAFKCTIGYYGVASIEQATHVFAVPLPHCGTAAICQLHRARDNEKLGSAASAIPSQNPKTSYYFEFQRICYHYDQTAATGHLPGFNRLAYPIAKPIDSYLRSRGHVTKASEKEARAYFGKNIIKLPLPAFWDLFVDHLLAPFFVFQVFCVALWMLDEYWYYSLFTLAMLLLFEVTVCYTRLRSMRDLRGQKRPGQKVYVFREDTWSSSPVISEDLVPGDIISLKPSEEKSGNFAGTSCPCDVLLLSGSAVANEAMLTGESIPKLKESLESTSVGALSNLEADRLAFTDGTDKRHSKSVLFCGTQILKVESDITSERGTADKNAASNAFCAPDGGCVGFVLRTGFGTTQGELMRTILFATERVTVGNTETLWFIVGLLMFAVTASAYVLNEGLKDAAASRWKLFLHCTMIITSVVPPELPMELSLAVTNSLNALRRHMVYCVEPFRIPFAGKVDVCCFDKTGTLTSDHFRVVGVAMAPVAAAQGAVDASDVQDMVSDLTLLNRHTVHVMAACNSLIWLDNRMTGDPMEVATVEAVNWIVRSDNVLPQKMPCTTFFGDMSRGKKRVGIQIIRRLGFSSALKRMSVVVRASHEEDALYVLTKGAPETIATLLSKDAVNMDAYHDAQKRHTSTGRRVLALAYRRLDGIGVISSSQVQKMSRESLESELCFAGLLVLDSPLKPQSKPAVGQLLRSAHRVVVITGDNALTACSVSTSLNIMKRPQECQLILKPSESGLRVAWFPVIASSAVPDSIPFDSAAASICRLGKKFDLCVTGPALSWLARSHANSKSTGQEDSSRDEYIEPEVPMPIMQSLACNALVYARTAPVQKERVLTALNSLGLTTLMCGDGTNDVGALKQAHVGISIINDIEMDKKAEEKSRVQEKLTKQASKKKNTIKKQELYEALRQMEMEQNQQMRMVQLGDASVASPFTSKTASIACAVDIIRQGRCTLVTTLQMYKILAVNCLLGAYSLSVLYLHGVKQGDTQMTFIGLSVAAFFFFISRSKPRPFLAEERPPSRVFSPFVILSVSCQFIIHFFVLSSAIWLCDEHVDPSDPSMMQDGDFRPNVINTVVFLVSIIMQVNSFGANYRGEPFMESLLDNKGLNRSLLGGWSIGLICATDVLTPLNDLFQLVPLPTTMLRVQIVGLLIIDTMLIFGVEMLIRKFYGSEGARLGAIAHEVSLRVLE